ncbi:lysine-specific demethylase 8 [Fusarium longipes]|uniref:Lysine-specific demethylase 8 n=1 Tax=Fusarium longipes TaxID=694270 RepID=A0A395RNW8_9HYPO|nr:lysine-specific demethylase 8 [Fusarium longipes]
MVPYEIYASTDAQKESVALFRDYLEKEQTQDKTITRSWDSCFTDSINDQEFFQLYAPLHLFTKVLDFNNDVRKKGLQGISIYIAQCSIADLPQALQEDIPTPGIVKYAGKGDIYGSSIWLGIVPTYTPLHRDPNPNIFCQLSGTKVVRLMAPKAGDWLFGQIQAGLRRSGNSRIRTDEMMQGEERQKLYQAVWETDPNSPVPPGTYEAILNPGDAMFIPTHYWHSVKSVGESGDLNASVNWWFR